MAKILVGIAMWQPHKLFLESLPKFYSQIKHNHDVEIYVCSGMPLVDAQNEFAEYMLNNDHEYLLTLEDDHWGHTPEMLESLLNANTYMCGIRYYSRHPFYMCTLMKYSDCKGKSINKRYVDFPLDTKGYHECDLVPFGMTLIKRELFTDVLDKPYFRLNHIYDPIEGEYYTYGTDRNFCDRMIQKGIYPVGCFDHTLTHDDINDKTIWFYRCETMKLYKGFSDRCKVLRRKGKKQPKFHLYYQKHKHEVDECVKSYL